MPPPPQNPRNPAPSRQAVLTRVTPLGTDVLFYVLKDGKLPDYREPVYGQPWPGLDYPNHLLVHVAPADEQGWYRWYYAADRANQDQYNFEIGSFDLGGIEMNAVFRTYIDPREDVDLAEPAIGTTLASREPDTLWATVGSEGDWLLADTEVKRDVEAELASRYIVARHTYVERISALGRKYDSKLKGTFHTTRILYYRGESVDGSPIEDLFLNPSAGYWGMPRVGFFREGEQVNQDWFVVYERETIGVDGTTGSGLAREGLSRSLSAKPDSIDRSYDNASSTPTVAVNELGYVATRRSVEQEDGTWVNSVSWTAPVVGNLQVSKRGSTQGVATQTESVETTQPAASGLESSFSWSVTGRDEDGIAVQYSATSEVVVPATGVVSTNVGADAKGVTTSTTEFQQTGTAPTPEPGVLGFSTSVSQRNVSGDPIQYEIKNERITVATGEVDVSLDPNVTGIFRASSQYTELPLPDTTPGMTGYTSRVALRDVTNEPALYEGRVQSFTAAGGIISETLNPSTAGVSKTQTSLVQNQPTLNLLENGGSWKVLQRDTNGQVLAYEQQIEEFNATSDFLSLSVDSRAGYTVVQRSKVTPTPQDLLEAFRYSNRVVRLNGQGSPTYWEESTTELVDNPTTSSQTVAQLQGGVATVSSSLVADGTEADSGFDVISSQVEPVGDDKSVRQTVRLAAFAEVDGTSYDNQTKSLIQVHKKIVPAGTVGSKGANFVIEIDPLDKWRSVQVTSTLIEPPTGYVDLPTKRINFQIPPVLNSARLRNIYLVANDAYGGVKNVDFAMETDITPGYVGSFRGRKSRIIHTSQPTGISGTDLPVFRPRSHEIFIGASWGREILIGTDHAQANVVLKSFIVPATIHDTIIVDVDPLPSDFSLLSSTTLAATSPSSITPGWYIYDADITEWRFGYWIEDKVEIYLE